MARTPTANCNATMVAWARADQGYSLDLAARKLGYPADRVLSWESGDEKPSIAQLRKMATLYRRPLALFFMSEPPPGFEPMNDFRRMPDAEDMRWSPELRGLIQRVQSQQRSYALMLGALGEQVPALPEPPTHDDPERLGEFARQVLGVEVDEQRQWRDKYEAFKGWRQRVEDAGVLVLHTSSQRGQQVPLNEMLGFSDPGPTPVIVLNGSDQPRRRLFTLLHEFAHLLLRNSGVCDLHDRVGNQPFDPTEVFCNAVAAATLMPAADFLASSEVKAGAPGSAWTDQQLRDIGERFTSSQEAVLRRLLTLGLTNEGYYRSWRTAYYQRLRNEAAEASGTIGGPSYYPMKVRELGAPYIRVVLEAHDRNIINTADVSDYLGVKLKNLPRIEEATYRNLERAS